MTRIALLVLLVLLGGCYVPDPPPARVDARALALGAPTCVLPRAPFSVEVTLENLEVAPGVAGVIVFADQYGRVVNEDVPLAPSEVRTFAFETSIDVTGAWRLHVLAPASNAEAVMVRIDPAAC